MNYEQITSFGELLKTFRKQKRVGQQQVAEQLAVHRNTIGAWERGDRLPDTRGMVLKLARCLHLNEQETARLLEASLTGTSTRWNVPYRRNPFFTGREERLQRLHQLLRQEKAAALTQSLMLSGLGGVGKTQLAVEYAHLYAQQYASVFWINADTTESLLSSYTALAALLEISEQHEPDQQKVVAAYTLAEPLYLRALSLWEQQGVRESPQLAASLHGLANLYQSQGKYKQAEPIYQRAIAIREQQLGPDHADLASPLTGLANLYFDLGRYEQAERLYRRAISIREQWLGPEHPLVSVPLNNLADLYHDQGKYAEAEALFLRALRLLERQSGAEPHYMAHPLNNLALLYARQGKHAEAEALFQHALSIREQQLGPHHPDTAETLHEFAVLRELQGKHQEALALYQRALTIREQTPGPENPQTRTTRERLTALRQGISSKTVVLPHDAPSPLLRE